MANKPTIAFRVSEGQKSKWEDYAEDNDEYGSLSHLIRVAVSHEMSDQYGADSGKDGTPNDQIGELITSVQKMEGRLEDVEDSVKDATEAAYEGPRFHSSASKGGILKTIPTGRENAIDPQEIAASAGINLEDTQQRMDLQSILFDMANVEGVIKTVETDNTTYYYRVE
jgi:hypothetical protein